MYPVDGVCVFLKLPISLPVNANGGRHMDATSAYRSNVCAAVYLLTVVLFRFFFVFLVRDSNSCEDKIDINVNMVEYVKQRKFQEKKIIFVLYLMEILCEYCIIFKYK